VVKINYLTKDKILVRQGDGSLIAKEINIGTDEEPQYIKMTPLVFGEILKLGRTRSNEEREKMVIQLLSEHLIEPKLTVEEIMDSDNVIIQKLIDAMNTLSSAKTE
jgi:hypothetical protein